ncbi:MAG: hypothetical protein AAGC55_08950 [Myxococcota bacterium]
MTCKIEVGMPIRPRRQGHLPLARAQRIAAEQANAAAYKVLDRNRGVHPGVCDAIAFEMNARLGRQVNGARVGPCGQSAVSHRVPVVRWPGPPPQRPAEDSGETCELAFPSLDECWELPGSYHYPSAGAALQAIKVSEGDHSLTLHRSRRTDRGPCADRGMHYNVRTGSSRKASIVCCPCCSDDADGPSREEQCAIIW